MHATTQSLPTPEGADRDGDSVSDLLAPVVFLVIILMALLVAAAA